MIDLLRDPLCSPATVGVERLRAPGIGTLLLVALVVLGAGLGLRDPWPADEPRFALIARQMVDTGDWLFPHRGVELYSDKPPLFMWVQAVLYRATGNLRIAFLLPSLLAGLMTIALTYDLGRRLWNRQVGLHAGWALLLTVQFTLQMKRAQIDPLLVAWVTLAHYGVLRHLLQGPDWRMWTLGWFAMGLGVITKGVGIIALLVLVPAIAAHLSLRAMASTWWRSPKFWLGPLALLSAIALWLVPMLVAVWIDPAPGHVAYVQDLLFRQTLDRYADAWTHHQPPLYFLGVMASSWLPLLLVLPWALVPWWRRIRRGDLRMWSLLGGWVLIVVFFSIPSGKRDMYILPALPLACLAFAPLLPGLLRRKGPRRLLLGFLVLLALALCLGGLTALFADPVAEQRLLASRGMAPQGTGLAWLLIAMALPVSVAAMLAASGRLLAGLVLGLAGMWIAFGFAGAIVLNDASSSRGLMMRVAEEIGPDAELGLVGWREQQLLMAPPSTTEFGFSLPPDVQLAHALAWQSQSAGNLWLLIEEEGLPSDRFDAWLIDMGTANRRNWWLLPPANLCMPDVIEPVR